MREIQRGAVGSGMRLARNVKEADRESLAYKLLLTRCDPAHLKLLDAKIDLVSKAAQKKYPNIWEGKQFKFAKVVNANFYRINDLLCLPEKRVDYAAELAIAESRLRTLNELMTVLERNSGRLETGKAETLAEATTRTVGREVLLNMLRLASEEFHSDSLKDVSNTPNYISINPARLVMIDVLIYLLQTNDYKNSAVICKDKIIFVQPELRNKNNMKILNRLYYEIAMTESSTEIINNASRMNSKSEKLLMAEMIFGYTYIEAMSQVEEITDGSDIYSALERAFSFVEPPKAEFGHPV